MNQNKIQIKKVAYIAAILLVLLVVSVAIASAQEGNKRVIAHTDEEVSDALANGCEIVRDAKTLKAFVCSEDVASSLGLEEDIQVFATDSEEDLEDLEDSASDSEVNAQDLKANTQIRASLVQESGNNGEGRKIVILDTGYNYNHQELSSSYLGGKDFVNNDDDPLDDNGHGSHVAGIITADGVDAKAKGVAPLAGIIAGKVLGSSGSGYFSDVVAAIYWAVDGPDGIVGTADDFNADAISISLGTSTPYTYKGFCDSILPDLTNAIKYAVGRGVIVVVAAGNSGGAGVSIPGCISYSTTVGAVDSKDKITTFSGKGSAVDIVAPGVNIYSAWLGTSYVTASGTSMATPIVSGTAALIKFAHPEYTSSQIQDALFKTAKDLGKTGYDTSYGWGRVDAYGAVNYIQ